MSAQATVSDRADVVVVGGGIAGGALGLALARAGLAVTILEFQDTYRDLVRGEMLSPWGLGDAERLGVADAIYQAAPAPLRRWVQWDEVYHPDEAPTIDLTQTFVPDVGNPHAIHHYKTCSAFVSRAARSGATVRMGVRDLDVQPGRAPSVTYTFAGRPCTTNARLVIGAGGRHGPVGRNIGLRLTRESHYWGGGLSVSGLDDWPDGVQAMGTEGRRMFFVFPQRGGRARLYLNFPTADRYAFAGPRGTSKFQAAFDLKCLPMSDMVLDATPTGPCMTSPSTASMHAGDPFIEGVVLIGDEAGANDPVLGTGLSNALRDARIVAEILLNSSSWRPESFASYATERRERMRRLHFAAGLLGTLSVQFGPDAAARRRRAWDRMRKNQNYMVTLMCAMAGPDRVPDFGFSDFLVERLLADDTGRTFRSPRLARLAG